MESKSIFEMPLPKGTQITSMTVEATFEYNSSDQIKSNWGSSNQQSNSALVFKGIFRAGLLNGRVEIALKRYQMEASVEKNDIILKEIERNLQVLSSNKNKHPNLIRYFGRATRGEFWYVATELCECSVVDIVKYLAQKSDETAMPQRDELFENISSSLPSKEIFRQSLEAVSFLHGSEMQMIHRNLHPNNFLISCIDPNKNYFLVKLTDFHLSKRIENNSGENTGTYNQRGWFAPESSDQTKNLTNKVDSFILGLYYFYILSGGKHPFGKAIDTDQRPGIKNPDHDVYKPNWDGEPHFTVDVSNQEETKRALQLIKDMIKFDPDRRKSVDEVLKSSYFQLEPYNIYDHPSSPIPGLCVIICLDKYHSPIDDVDYQLDYLGNRHEGIGLDAKKLEETFKSFGYDILSFKNLRAAQIEGLLSSTTLEDLIKKSNKSLKNYASLVVCILGHGDKGVINGVDGVPVSLNTIQYDAFNDQACPDLKGKPKIFIVLACQGDKKQIIPQERSNHTGSMASKVYINEKSGSFMTVPFINGKQSLAPINRSPNSVIQESLPPVYDFIRLASTIEEYETHFVFIKSLCDALRNEYKEVTNPELKEKNNRDITQLFTELVIPTVGRSGGNIKQTPEFRSSLVKAIRFRHKEIPGVLLQEEYNGETDDESFYFARKYNETLQPGCAIKKRNGYEYVLKTVYGEAFNEPEEVQLAIAWVIFNRYKKLYRPEWGVGNMMRVCMATDQFKCWVDKEDIAMPNLDTRSAIEDWLPTTFDGVDPTGGSTYFNKPADEGFMEHLVQTFNIESYQFYKDS